MSYLPIESHGVIGDLCTVALVGTDGTIDFMCAPRFDSPTVFGSLLDDERGGSFCIEPLLGDAKPKQIYLPDTNVLLTRFLSASGVAEISDFMPIEKSQATHQIVRRVKAVRGEIGFRMRCAPRFDYGRVGHRIEREDDCTVLFTPEGNGIVLRLCSSVPMRIEEGDATVEFTLSAGESVSFVLEEARPGGLTASAGEDYVPRAFQETVDFWRRWIGRSTYQGRWRDMVHRSALVLKLLVSDQYGSLVAAPTFGLPEAIGGVRNWDYRYTWIRDAAFTLYSLIRLGLTEETGKFMNWIAARCNELEPGAPLQPLYGIDGRHELPEIVLDHWEGYRGSRPVRIGNAASDQLQLDIYGALLDSAFLYDKYGEPISYDLWLNLSQLVEWVCDNWRRPGHGIWEVRGELRPFVGSRLMCWVALDRAIRLATARSFPFPLAHWLETRDAIFRSLYDEFWNPEIGAFVQYPGASDMDASVLLMPLLRFISPVDPRWLSTLRAVEDQLVDDSLVRRYCVRGGAADGIADPEGTFSICSFWYAEALGRSGDLQQARLVFEKMLGYANHLGLYAEELGRSGEHLGNFPQAFTHLALISAAFDLDRRLSGAGWEA